MPSATSEKLSQLRQQLQECTNPKVAQVLRGAIAKLEAQLSQGTTQTKTPKADHSKIAERKAALKQSQREANRIASRQQRTTLKPPSLSTVEAEATFQNGTATAQSQNKSQELSTAQSEDSSSQDTPKPQTEPSLQNDSPAPANQSQAKATPQQQQAAKTSKAKSKHQDRPRQKQPLLLGNGTHRAWCRITGIIRVREVVEDGKPKSIYFLEVDGQPVKLFLGKKIFKHLKPILDKPAMVFGYPNIMNGQITALQLTGTSKQVSTKTENFVLIGVWRAHNQRVLIQRDQKLDPEIPIRQNSPLVSEECLKKLEGGKLYEFTCHREGVTVTVVDVEAMANELPNGT